MCIPNLSIELGYLVTMSLLFWTMLNMCESLELSTMEINQLQKISLQVEITSYSSFKVKKTLCSILQWIVQVKGRSKVAKTS